MYILYICMYVCIFCMSVCMYILYICMYVCIFCMSVCLYILYICMYVCIFYTYVCMYILYVCMYVYFIHMYVCIFYTYVCMFWNPQTGSRPHHQVSLTLPQGCTAAEKLLQDCTRSVNGRPRPRACQTPKAGIQGSSNATPPSLAL